MTDQDPMRPDPGTDPALPTLTAALSGALHEQADRFEPSSDSYRKLAEAVNRRERPSVVTWLRPAAAAAAVAAIAGVGVLALAGSESQTLGTGPGEETAVGDGDESEAGDGAASTAPAGDTAGAVDEEGETEEGENPEPDRGPDEVAASDAYGPVRDSELEAAQAFLDLLGLPYAAPELDGDRVVVRSFAAGGLGEDGEIVAELTVVEVSDGFAAVAATSESVLLDAVAQGDLDGGALRVEGRGIGFEGTLDVRAVSAHDDRVLAVGTVTAGSIGEAVPFATELPVVGTEDAWVVVSSSGGADGVTDPFAALPTTFRSVPDPAEYTVVRVPADDADGGLRLRAGPGTDTATLSVLPSGSAGINRTAELPARNGADVWWAVATPAGQGWVNANFVAAAGPAPALADLDPVVRRFAADLDGAPFAPAELPLTRRADVVVGTLGEPIRVDPDELRSGAGWLADRSVPTAGGTVEIDLATLYGLDGWSEADVVAGLAQATTDDQAAAAGYFGTLPSVTVLPAGGAGDPVHLFFEVTPGGPEVVGILLGTIAG